MKAVSKSLVFTYLSAGCVLKAGLFFVGAVTFAGIVHLIFSTFPTLHNIGNQPTLADRSFAYWGLALLAAMFGGLIVRWHDKPILEEYTSHRCTPSVREHRYTNTARYHEKPPEKTGHRSLAVRSAFKRNIRRAELLRRLR